MKKHTSRILDLEIVMLKARIAVEALEAIAVAAIEAARPDDERAHVDAGACKLLCGVAFDAFGEFNRELEAMLDAAKRLPPVVDTSGEPDE